VSAEVVSQINRDYMIRLAEKGGRLDDRSKDQFRQIQIRSGIIDTADGSAWVNLGSTQVIAGVKMNLGVPYPDHPDKGALSVSAEFIPPPSHQGEANSPRDDAIELARVVDRGIREGNALDMSQLCITAGEEVWVLFIDLQIINSDGNLFDASMLAAMAALDNTRMPDSDGNLTEKTLPLVKMPLCATTVKLGHALLVDPTYQEEAVCDSRLTITLDEDGHVRAMQKGLCGSFTIHEIETMIENSSKSVDHLRNTLKNASSSQQPS